MLFKDYMLLLDFGTTSAKILHLKKGGKFSFLEIPLGFALDKNLSLKLSYVLEEAKKAFKEKPSIIIGKLPSDFKFPGKIISKKEAFSVLDFSLIEVGEESLWINGKFVESPNIETEKVLRWLPFLETPSTIGNFLANKKIYCQILPTTPRDLVIEQAICREKIRETQINADEKADLRGEVVLSGAVLSKVPRLAQAILMFLDGFEPLGKVQVKLDQDGLLPFLGALRLLKKDFFEDFSSEVEFLTLGTTLKFKESVFLEVDFGLEEIQELKVEENELLLLPLEKGSSARIKVKGRKEEEEIEVWGGEVGVVVDTRLYPLDNLLEKVTVRSFLKKWDKALGAHGQIAPL